VDLFAFSNVEQYFADELIDHKDLLMITIEYLTELGKNFASRGSLSSPVVLIEYGKGRGVIPVADLAAESQQQAMYKVGCQAGRDERHTGRVEQVAVLAAGRMANPDLGVRPSEADRQEVLIVSSWVKGSGAEHIIYRLEHRESGRVELSVVDPQPERIASPILEELINGYRDGQAALKREREKKRELEY
jgi:predicted methyltransferase MtxX (methanogen marker protein 4)